MKAQEKKELGNWGEQLVIDKLTAEGWQIREHQWRFEHYEIDIVAQKDDVLAIVEVKTRTDRESDPLEAITPRKKANMVAAARAYLATCECPFQVQFDVVGINGTSYDDYTMEYIADAFYPSVKTY